MPFTNPIVAGSTLVREAIRSPDYEAGVSGWSINRDGTAEFSDATIRGRLKIGDGALVGDSVGSRAVEILPQSEVPIELSDPYAPFGIAVAAVIILRSNNGAYWWTATCIHPVSEDLNFVEEGVVTAGGDRHVYGRRRYNTLMPVGALSTLDASATHYVDGQIIVRSGGTLEVSGGVLERSGYDQGVWNTFTPVWTATTTNPSLGSGFLAGEYSVVGDTVTYHGRLTSAVDTTYGTGLYRISLPIPAVDNTLAVGVAYLHDSSTATNQQPGSVRLIDANTMSFNAVGGEVSPTVPFTFANGDQIRWSITYKAAIV